MITIDSQSENFMKDYCTERMKLKVGEELKVGNFEDLNSLIQWFSQILQREIKFKSPKQLTEEEENAKKGIYPEEKHYTHSINDRGLTYLLTRIE